MEEKTNSEAKVCMGGVCDHDCTSCGSCGNNSTMMLGNRCGSMGCAMGYGHRHYGLRWLLGILILGIVFSMGVMFGEIKGYLRNDGPSIHGYYRTMPTMQYFSAPVPSDTMQ